MLTAAVLVAAAAVTLPLTAAAVEAVIPGGENLILPAHLLLMAVIGAAVAALVAGRSRTARTLAAGGAAGVAAAVVADVGWLLAIAG